jgi:hypothetical protein
MGRLKFDVADLRHLAAETGKFEMMLINFPHNPTGACLTAAEMREVLEVARDHAAWVFSDEMYRGLGAKSIQGSHRMRVCSACMSTPAIVGACNNTWLVCGAWRLLACICCSAPLCFVWFVRICACLVLRLPLPCGPFRPACSWPPVRCCGLLLHIWICMCVTNSEEGDDAERKAQESTEHHARSKALRQPTSHEQLHHTAASQYACVHVCEE